MLFAAGHVKNDVPSVLNAYAAEHGIRVDFGRDLGIDPKLLRAARDRIEAALASALAAVPREDTLLAVIGRGTSDPDANGNVAKVARMLWEGMGFGWAEVGYSGVAHPRVDALLERAARLGFRRIVVFPYFLFTGRPGPAHLRPDGSGGRAGIPRSSSSRPATSTTIRSCSRRSSSGSRGSLPATST